MKYIGYTRVSTEDQATEGVSLEAQADRIRKWAASRDGVELGMFTDAGVSGKSMHGRVGLADALELAEKTDDGVVFITYSLSRLARSTSDALTIAGRLKKANANLVSITEQIDTTSAAGEMFFTMLAGFAQFERALTVERTKAALAFKRGRGERISGRLPFGMELAPDGKHLVPNLTEQSWIKQMQDWRANGLTYRGIAECMRTMGQRTKEGRLTWEATTVRRILGAKIPLDIGPKV